MRADTVIHFLMFFGPLFAVIIALGQITRPGKGKIDYVFAASFGGMGVWMFQICLYSTGVFSTSFGIYYLVTGLVPFAFLVPTLMVLRYKWILSRDFQIKPMHRLMFLPVLISLPVIMAPLFFNCIETPSVYYPGLPFFSAQFESMPVYSKLVYSMYFLPNIYLIVFMFPVLIQMSSVWTGFRRGGHPVAARAGYVFAAVIVISNILCVAGALYSFELIKASILMANTATIMVFIVTQRRPDYLRLLQSETRRAHYEKSRLLGIDVKRITGRLYEIMEDEKAFADEDLNLGGLADELGISYHQLSEILNERINKNFNTFVNTYRVNEAKKLLVDEPDRSVLSIGVAVGFNSNTTFCTVFQKMAGCSPGQYRKSNCN